MNPLKLRLATIAGIVLALGLVAPAWTQSNANQDSTAPQNTAEKNIAKEKKPKGPGKQMGDGGKDIGKGAAKGSADLAVGAGKGVGKLATGHPVDATASVGKGAGKFGKNVGVGAGKGTAKIGKGIGGEFKKLHKKKKPQENEAAPAQNSNPGY